MVRGRDFSGCGVGGGRRLVVVDVDLGALNYYWPVGRRRRRGSNYAQSVYSSHIIYTYYVYYVYNKCLRYTEKWSEVMHTHTHARTLPVGLTLRLPLLAAAAAAVPRVYHGVRNKNYNLTALACTLYENDRSKRNTKILRETNQNKYLLATNALCSYYDI